MSAWRRSICSTRKTRRRLAAAYSWPEVAVAAVVAAAVEVAEVAEVAEAAVAAAAAAAEEALAAPHGVSVASAKSQLLADTIDKRKSRWPGPTRSTRPFHVFSPCLLVMSACVRKGESSARRRTRRRWLAGFPILAKNASARAGLQCSCGHVLGSRWRLGVICKMRVLTP
jgi:hypothetical protein